MRSVVDSNPTQGSFFFEKRESCPGCISLSCLIVMYIRIYVVGNQKLLFKFLKLIADCTRGSYMHMCSSTLLCSEY